MSNKRKIEGLSFQLFAIASLLIVLPVSTAFVSNLASMDSQRYESINDEYVQDQMNILNDCQNWIGNTTYQLETGGFDFLHLISWIDKGTNATSPYMQINTQNDDVDNNGIPDGQDPNNYQFIWDEDSFEYQSFIYRCWPYQGFAFPPSFDNRNGDILLSGFDNHAWASFISGWHGYEDLAGDEFSFKIHDNYFKYLDSNKDLSALKLQFIDQEYSFSCDSIIFDDIQFKSDITFYYKDQQIKFSNFDFDVENKYEVNNFNSAFVENYQNGTAQPSGDICHVNFPLEFELFPVEALQFNELVQGDYANLSAIVDIYDLDYDNQYVFVALQNSVAGGGNRPAIAFLGDGSNSVLFEVAYTDTTSTNFFLKGGTIILGVGMFALALASTPYWNPVVQTFKPKGGV